MISFLCRLPRGPAARRSVTVLGIVGTLCLTLAACGTNGGAKSGGANAAAGKPTKLTVQLALVPPKMIFLGFYVAQDKGFFARNGLSVDLVPESTGAQAVRGVVAGHGFFAAGGTDGLASADAAGGKLVGIWTYGTDDLSIISAQKVASLKDLAGTTIGVTDKVGPAYTLPVLALESVGLKAEDAKYAVLGGRPALVTALSSGRIQAAAFHVDDGLTVAKKDPQVHIIAQMSQVVPKWWYGAVSADTSFARAHPEVVEAFLTAMIQAQRWMYQNPAETIAIGVKYTKEDPDIVAAAYKTLAGNHNWTIDKTGLNEDDVNYTLDEYRKDGVIPPSSKIGYKDVVDTRYIDAVLRKLGPGSY